MAERDTSYGFKFGEGETKEGQVVQFTAPSDSYELARNALAHFRSITLPNSSIINIEHGGYGRYSRYDIEQIEYGGGQNEAGGGYYEILKIYNAPDERHPIVSHGYINSGEWFSEFFAEWESVEDAKAHWEKVGLGKIITAESLNNTEQKQIKGLIRVVDTGYLSPWFYATGDASLVGDYVFPEHLTQDPTYTFGRQFLVPEKSDRSGDMLHTLKTCMGCAVRQERRGENYWGHPTDSDTIRQFRAVQWHDGTVSEVYPSTPKDMIPVPLAENDLWVTEAQRKFNEMLSGGNMNFEVKFADGGKFVGKYMPPAEKTKANAAGDYYAVVTLDDGKVFEGWVNDFTPTANEPTVTSLIENRYTQKKMTCARIEITQAKVKSGGKKWQGVYYGSLPPEPDGA